LLQPCDFDPSPSLHTLLLSRMPPTGSFPSSSSMGHRATMDFTDTWGEGYVFAWYRKRQKSSVTVTRLQIRIDRGKPPHRFVLAYLQDGVICRFDRRPEAPKLGTVVLETLGGARIHRAADGYCVLQNGEFEMLESSTRCEIEINMPPNTTLLHILSACFALAQDTEARDYALLKYNCYFFSWAIIMVVARHVLPFVAPTPANVIERLLPSIDSITSRFTEKIANTLLDILADVVTTFRGVLGPNWPLSKGMRMHERLVWNLPTRTTRFVVRQTLKMQFYPHLEKKLKQQTRDQLMNVFTPLLEDVLRERNTTNEKFSKHLWIDELVDYFRPLIREQLEDTVWDAVLNIYAPGHSTVETQGALHTQGNLISRIKHRLCGHGYYLPVWSAGLNATLSAIHNAADCRSRSDFASSREMHTEMFDTAFKAASHAAREASQDVVRDLYTREEQEIWNKSWSFWDKGWEASSTKAQSIAVERLEEMVDEIGVLLTTHIVAEIGINQDQAVQGSVKYQVS
jgi:hypothetical protein